MRSALVSDFFGFGADGIHHRGGILQGLLAAGDGLLEHLQLLHHLVGSTADVRGYLVHHNGGFCQNTVGLAVDLVCPFLSDPLQPFGPAVGFQLLHHRGRSRCCGLGLQLFLQPGAGFPGLRFGGKGSCQLLPQGSTFGFGSLGSLKGIIPLLTQFFQLLFQSGDPLSPGGIAGNGLCGKGKLLTQGLCFLGQLVDQSGVLAVLVFQVVNHIFTVEAVEGAAEILGIGHGKSS